MPARHLHWGRCICAPQAGKSDDRYPYLRSLLTERKLKHFRDARCSHEGVACREVEALPAPENMAPAEIAFEEIQRKFDCQTKLEKGRGIGRRVSRTEAAE